MEKDNTDVQKKLIQVLQQCQRRYPYLRTLQLIHNACPPGVDPYNVGDLDLTEYLIEYLNRKFQA